MSVDLCRCTDGHPAHDHQPAQVGPVTVLRPCDTRWRWHGAHAAVWHECTHPDGLHDGLHECACGDEFPGLSS